MKEITEKDVLANDKLKEYNKRKRLLDKINQSAPSYYFKGFWSLFLFLLSLIIIFTMAFYGVFFIILIFILIEIERTNRRINAFIELYEFDRDKDSNVK